VNPLGDVLARRIRAHGPLTVADFMAEALGHPDYGYYTTRDPLGRAGDFTTAPEISQVFGELIGLWCVDLWTRMGRPNPILLAELGPGRGTLMRDALRAARLVPEFLAAARLHLVESSPVLRRTQARALAAHKPAWHETIATLPPGPLLVIANEFFDALPIRQFVKTEAGWREKLVGLSAEADALAFALSPGPTPAVALVPPGLREAPPGSVAEIGAAGLSVADGLAERIVAAGGAALVIDYGYLGPASGDTLQAVQRHRRHDPLEAPGSADLTAHVDFTALADAAHQRGAWSWGPVPQGAFLQALGIAARLERLLQRAAPGQAADLGIAVRRLIDPAEMGTLFKVLCIAAPGLPPPAGFPQASPGAITQRPTEPR
jgi:NADH dehydrogenase [ubiquinone] 1 alpha subcomplex assembly factor 7